MWDLEMKVYKAIDDWLTKSTFDYADKKLREDYFTDNPLIIFFTIIAEDIDYCKVVNFSKNANFGKKSIYLLSDILALADTDEMANDYDRDINKLVNTFNESLNLAA